MPLNDRKSFALAAAEYAASPGNSASIETMMRLACEGVQPGLRRWAAGWLKAHCNIAVIEAELGEEDAAPSKATGSG